MSPETLKNSQILDKVFHYLDDVRKLYKFRKESPHLIPKTGIVRLINKPVANFLDADVGGKIKIDGEAYPPIDHILGKRTVFLAKPVVINGDTRWIEIKGYGQNGRQLYLHHHIEGDLMYGMYLDNAQREYDLLLKAQNLGLNVPVPIVVCEIPEEEFLNYGLGGFAQVFTSRMMFKPDRLDWILQILKSFRQIPELGNYSDKKSWLIAIGEIISEILKDAYQKGREELLEVSGSLNIQSEIGGLLSGKSAGFVVRAVKSPFRVGDLHDKSIVTSENKKTAKKVGNTFRKLLENGLLHISPNPGNWTQASELTDFADVIKIPDEIKLLEKEMERRQIYGRQQFFYWLVGEGNTGFLAQNFAEGIVGEGSVEKAARYVQRMVFG